jgi:hypothetical protein
LQAPAAARSHAIDPITQFEPSSGSSAGENTGEDLAMMKTTFVVAEIALGFSLPASADSTFDIAHQVCGWWLASRPMMD